MKKRAVVTIVVAGLTWSIAATSLAAPITQVHLFGAPNLDCTSEVADCAPELLPGGPGSIVTGGIWNVPYIFTNIFNGGYRPGGYVAWDFFFDDSAFTSIESMMLDVDIVGFIYASGNIDPQQGQIGNYFAIDGVPFAPIAPPLDNLDGRNHHSFVLPILAPGAHQFSVWAFEPLLEEGPYMHGEGWGGVDFAKLTINGDFQTLQAAAVPEPASLVLLGTGLLGVARIRRRYLRQESTVVSAFRRT